MSKKRFHTLDALRFFAFLKVYLLHLPEQGDFPIFEYIKKGGGLGVLFFFVLSGFLITYILIHDKQSNGQIKPRKFFMRRSLRIWPLYFLLVMLVYALPYALKEQWGLHMIANGYDLDGRFSFTFLENYKMILADSFPKTTPLSVFWSLCVEEHFYILWMLMTFGLPVKHFPKFLIISILIAIVARHFELSITHNQVIDGVDLFTNLDLFALGGLLGYAAATRYEELAKLILKIPIAIKWMVVMAVTALLIFHADLLPYLPQHPLLPLRVTAFGIAFTLLIAIFIPVDSNFKIKDNHPISYLGRISYGLYVYHILIIHMMLQYCFQQNIVLDNWKTLGGFIAISFSLSVLVSTVSYYYFEKPILKWRERLVSN